VHKPPVVDPCALPENATKKAVAGVSPMLSASAAIANGERGK
jgi:hypothetical protein